MKLACYVRAARGRERAEVREWLTANGVRDAEVEWYTDPAGDESAARPALNRLIADVAAGEVQTVVLWRLDRLGPRLQDGVTTLADWCGRGLKVVVVEPRLELHGAVGPTLAALLLGLARMERDYRRGRQAAGIADAKGRGAYKGRARGTTKASPDRVRELKSKGLTVFEIAQAVGVSERTVTRYLGQVEGAGVPPAAE